MTTKHWIKQIQDTTRDFQSAFGALTDDQMNWKPLPDTWSIAQNIRHLIMVNESYFPTLAALRRGTYRTPFAGKFGFIANFIGNTVLKAVQPDRKKKMKTFSIWKPREESAYADILNIFEKHHEALISEIGQSEELLNKGIVISSPANKNVVYKLDVAFNIIVMHEQRHFEQAKEVLKILPR